MLRRLRGLAIRPGAGAATVRHELAQHVVAIRSDVATAVADAFLVRHPECRERSDEQAWLLGDEAVRHHLDFLAAAVGLGHPRSFIDYALWCRRVHDARSIDATFLIEHLEFIERELADRLDGEAATAAATILYATRVALVTPPTVAPRNEPTTFSIPCRVYTDAAIAGRRPEALAVAREALQAGANLFDVYEGIIRDALYEIGRRWATTQITVAEEHMASAVTQFVLAALYETMPAAAVDRGRAVVTGVAGEMHQIGANIIADALEADGWDVRFLGTNIPEQAILATISEHDPALVGISLTTVASIARVATLIEQIRALPGPRRRVLVGGRAFVHTADLWNEVGADGFARDVRSAVAEARAPAREL